MTKIVWNGCDNYVEADQAEQRGYDFDGEKLYHGAQEFMAFDATEIDPKDLPNDEDGEPGFNGVFGSERGKFYMHNPSAALVDLRRRLSHNVGGNKRYGDA